MRSKVPDAETQTHRGSRALVVSASLCLCATGMALYAETIDRIAVSVGNQVITASDLDRQIRLAAFLSGTAPDFSGAARHAMADRLVAQRLMLNEIETTHYVAPDPAAIGPALAEFKQKYFSGDQAYRRALEDAGLSETDVREELLRERLVTAFIDVRFHPAVQVTEQDIQEYFEKTVAPAARAAAPGQTVALEQFRDRIERSLTGERVDAEVERWLAEARRRNEIIYHREAFE